MKLHRHVQLRPHTGSETLLSIPGPGTSPRHSAQAGADVRAEEPAREGLASAEGTWPGSSRNGIGDLPGGREGFSAELLPGQALDEVLWGQGGAPRPREGGNQMLVCSGTAGAGSAHSPRAGSP